MSGGLSQNVNGEIGVYDLEVYKNELYAVGDFGSAGGVANTSNLARWNGASWSPAGGEAVTEKESRGMGRVLILYDEKLVFGGGFTKIGETSANRIAIWDGISWSPLGNGLNSYVEGLTILGKDLIAVGWFNHTESRGPLGLAKWQPSVPPAPWPPAWYGANKLSCQWHHRAYAGDPNLWTPEKGKGYAEDYHMSYFHWGFPPELPEGTKIIIDGEFPHARFFSLHVSPPWDGVNKNWRGGRGAPTITILDEDINPEPGHTNPFRPGANRQVLNRQYRVIFELRNGNPVALNPQAAVPPYRAPGNTRIGGLRTGGNGEYGPYIEYYIYVPDHYEKFGGVNLPTIYIQRPGENPVLSPPIRDIYFRDNLTPGEWVAPYAPEENPCLESGLAKKDWEQWQIRENYVRNILNSSAATEPIGTYDTRADGRRVGNELVQLKDYGVSRFSCTFSLPIAEARNSTTGCAATDKNIHHRGPDEPPPGNDPHTNGRDVMTDYLQAFGSFKPGEEVIIFSGKAPKTPKTVNGSLIAEASPELRHWSLCSYIGSKTLGAPTVTTADCILDEETILDQNGKFKLIFSTIANKPSNARPECGIVWRPWRAAGQRFDWNITSTANQTWPHALQQVPWKTGDYLLNPNAGEVTKNIMGEYFPTAKYATKASIEALGCPNGGGSTPDTNPPTLSSIVVSSIAQNSANISFVANELVDARIEYGPTTNYGLTQSVSFFANNQTITLSNLSAGLTYHYRIRAKDQTGNETVSINYTFHTLSVSDNLAPAKINDLAGTNITETSINLSWTSTGDDGNVGTATVYDIRYLDQLLTETNWESSLKATGEPTPSMAGLKEGDNPPYILIGLSPGNTYRVGIKTIDETGNISPLSNIITFTTLSPPPPANPPVSGGSPGNGGGGGGSFTPSDRTSPPNVSNFRGEGADKQIALSWTNPVSSDWVRTIVVKKENSAPISPNDGILVYEGNAPSFIDTGLINDKKYFYSIFTVDRVPNHSSAVSLEVSPRAGVIINTFESKTSSSLSNKEPLKISKIYTDLSLSSRGNEVLELQNFLIQNGFLKLDAPSSYFGPLTEKAVQQFQCQHLSICAGLPNTNGYGFVGPKTRAKINELLSKSTTGVSVVSSSEEEKLATSLKEQIKFLEAQIAELVRRQSGQSSPIQSTKNFTRDLSFGISGDDVKYLQEILIQESLLSAGLNSGYFGQLTQRAVIEFQKKYGVSPALGFVGPKTKSKLTELYPN